MNHSLVHLLDNFKSQHAEESKFAVQFKELLKSPRAFHRDHLPGHITGSAWVLNQSRTKVLLVHHAKLNKWLQPGGHADGDENVLRVALKELEEETGIKKLKPLLDGIFDIDIHPIPLRKDFPAHYHYDIRFVFEADESEPIQVSEESHDVKWIALSELPQLNNEPSILRMGEKSQRLK